MLQEKEQTLVMKKNNYYYRITISILTLTVVVLGYLLSKESTPTKVSEYENKIDSLYSIIETNKMKIDSLELAKVEYQTTIDDMKTKLGGMKEESKRIKDNYNEEITRIDNMSHNELVIEFTNAFK